MGRRGRATPGGGGPVRAGLRVLGVRPDRWPRRRTVRTGTAFRTGDEVLAEFSQSTDGSLTLTRLSTADDDEDTDDDGHDGDHHDGHHHGGDDHGGSGRH